MKTAILSVSFGTTHLDTLDKTIRAVENDLAASFQGAALYRAFTSRIVCSRLKSKYNIHADSVEEALERMKRDGVQRVTVLPTLLIPGEEYDLLRRDVLLHAGDLEVSMGLPLLWDDGDLDAMIAVLERSYPVHGDTVLLAMGHGSAHASNCLYQRLAEKMSARGSSIALCTVEGKPDFDDAVVQLKALGKRRVHLIPMLLVAGDHSKNDMAGEEPDSLRRILERAGFKVSWTLRGLGEIPEVRDMYVRRARAAL